MNSPDKFLDAGIDVNDEPYITIDDDYDRSLALCCAACLINSDCFHHALLYQAMLTRTS